MATIPISGSTTGATYDTTTKQINTISPPNPNNNGTIINTSISPIVDNSGVMSDVKTNSASYQSTLDNIAKQLVCSDVYKTRWTMKYRLTDDENLKKGVGVMNNNKATKNLSVIRFSLVDLLTAPCMNLNLFRQPSKS